MQTPLWLVGQSENGQEPGIVEVLENVISFLDSAASAGDSKVQDTFTFLLDLLPRIFEYDLDELIDRLYEARHKKISSPSEPTPPTTVERLLRSILYAICRKHDSSTDALNNGTGTPAPVLATDVSLYSTVGVQTEVSTSADVSESPIRCEVNSELKFETYAMCPRKQKSASLPVSPVLKPQVGRSMHVGGVPDSPLCGDVPYSPVSDSHVSDGERDTLLIRVRAERARLAQQQQAEDDRIENHVAKWRADFKERGIKETRRMEQKRQRDLNWIKTSEDRIRDIENGVQVAPRVQKRVVPNAVRGRIDTTPPRSWKKAQATRSARHPGSSIAGVTHTPTSAHATLHTHGAPNLNDTRVSGIPDEAPTVIDPASGASGPRHPHDESWQDDADLLETLNDPPSPASPPGKPRAKVRRASSATRQPKSRSQSRTRSRSQSRSSSRARPRPRTAGSTAGSTGSDGREVADARGSADGSGEARGRVGLYGVEGGSRCGVDEHDHLRDTRDGFGDGVESSAGSLGPVRLRAHSGSSDVLAGGRGDEVVAGPQSSAKGRENKLRGGVRQASHRPVSAHARLGQATLSAYDNIRPTSTRPLTAKAPKSPAKTPKSPASTVRSPTLRGVRNRTSSPVARSGRVPNSTLLSGPDVDAPAATTAVVAVDSPDTTLSRELQDEFPLAEFGQDHTSDGERVSPFLATQEYTEDRSEASRTRPAPLWDVNEGSEVLAHPTAGLMNSPEAHARPKPIEVGRVRSPIAYARSSSSSMKSQGQQPRRPRSRSASSSRSRSASRTRTRPSSAFARRPSDPSLLSDRESKPDSPVGVLSPEARLRLLYPSSPTGRQSPPFYLSAYHNVETKNTPSTRRRVSSVDRKSSTLSPTARPRSSSSGSRGGHSAVRGKAKGVRSLAQRQSGKARTSKQYSVDLAEATLDIFQPDLDVPCPGDAGQPRGANPAEATTAVHDRHAPERAAAGGRESQQQRSQTSPAPSQSSATTRGNRASLHKLSPVRLVGGEPHSREVIRFQPRNANGVIGDMVESKARAQMAGKESRRAASVQGAELPSSLEGDDVLRMLRDPEVARRVRGIKTLRKRPLSANARAAGTIPASSAAPEGKDRAGAHEAGKGGARRSS
eukprot:Rmarinus@m.17718